MSASAARAISSDKLPPDLIFQRIQERCENEFRFYARYFFSRLRGQKFQWVEELHGPMCDLIEDVYRGRHRNVILNVPPRHSKTWLMILFVGWSFVRNPRCEWMHLSFSDQLVTDNSDQVRELIKCKEHRLLWPALQIKPHADSKHAWKTTDGGVFLAIHATGPVTGFGAGRKDDVDPATGEFRFSGAIWIDDPLKPDDARSDKVREYVNDRWHNTLKSRRNSPRTPTFVTMQRLHQHDFSAARLEEREESWKLVKVPALLDEGLPTERALWPEMYSVAQLKAMRDSSMVAKASFYAQMQQEPRSLGGNLLQGRWFRRYDPASPPPILYKMIYVDTANKKGRQNDYTVFSVWGAREQGGIVLLDVLRDRMEAPELVKRGYRFWEKIKRQDTIHRGRLRAMKIEDKVSGTGLIQTLRIPGIFQDDDGSVVHRRPIPVLDIQRGDGDDMYQRVMDTSPWVEGGHVWVPHEGSTPWVDAFVAECEAFQPDDSHDHDDQVSTLCDAVADMLGAGQPVKINPEMLAEAQRGGRRR